MKKIFLTFCCVLGLSLVALAQGHEGHDHAAHDDGHAHGDEAHSHSHTNECNYTFEDVS